MRRLTLDMFRVPRDDKSLAEQEWRMTYFKDQWEYEFAHKGRPYSNEEAKQISTMLGYDLKDYEGADPFYNKTSIGCLWALTTAQAIEKINRAAEILGLIDDSAILKENVS